MWIDPKFRQKLHIESCWQKHIADIKQCSKEMWETLACRYCNGGHISINNLYFKNKSFKYAKLIREVERWTTPVRVAASDNNKN